jgi:hypothetical protein
MALVLGAKEITVAMANARQTQRLLAVEVLLARGEVAQVPRKVCVGPPVDRGG